MGSQIFSSAYCCANKKPYLSRFQGRSRSPGIAGEGSQLGAVAAVAFGSAKRARSEVRKGSWGPRLQERFIDSLGLIHVGTVGTCHDMSWRLG